MGAGESRRIHGLSELAESVQSSTTVNQLLARTATSALGLLGAASVSVRKYEHAHVRVIHNAGQLAPGVEPWPGEETYPLPDGQRFNRADSMPAPDWHSSVDGPRTEAADRFGPLRLRDTRAVAMPVRAGRTIWGEVYATRAGAADFDPVDLATGATVAGLLSAGLSRLELHGELTLLAYTDPLTGLANRRAADEWLEQRLGAAEPFTPVSVVLCDINGLKPVNDRFGHAAGDELIQRVADHLLLTSGGLSDTRVARIGGDEFVLLLAGPDRDEVAELVQRLAAFEVPYAAGLAVGVATETRRPAGPESATTAARALLRLADAAQYQHKHTRRLRTKTLSATVTPISVLFPSAGLRVTDRVLAAWAGDDDQGVLRRLSIVADEVARVFGAASWFVSRQHGAMLAEEMGWLLRSRSAGPLPLDLGIGQDFHPDEYPATRRALDGGGYYASLTDGDESERALIARMGYVSTLAAGERAADGSGWLVELFGDGATSSGMVVALPLLRALVHLAVAGAAPAISRERG